MKSYLHDLIVLQESQLLSVGTRRSSVDSGTVETIDLRVLELPGVTKGGHANHNLVPGHASINVVAHRVIEVESVTRMVHIILLMSSKERSVVSYLKKSS